MKYINGQSLNLPILAFWPHIFLRICIDSHFKKEDDEEGENDNILGKKELAWLVYGMDQGKTSFFKGSNLWESQTLPPFTFVFFKNRE